MNLQRACTIILGQLSDLVSRLSEDDFVKPAETLNGSTISQHLRHTLEFLFVFEQGCEKGLVNYDKRAHDKLIERDKFIALATLQRINDFVLQQKPDMPLKLEVSYDLKQDDFVTVDTNYTRELVYNIEHAVHHMAIMKIGVREIAPSITLPSDFGIAASTVRHKESK